MLCVTFPSKLNLLCHMVPFVFSFHFPVHVCLEAMGNKLENALLPPPIRRPHPRACPLFDNSMAHLFSVPVVQHVLSTMPPCKSSMLFYT